MAKRGPKVGDFYHVVGSTRVSPELDDLASRRVRGFLDTMGTQTRPLEHLLKEAWYQGLKDAVEATRVDATTKHK